MKLRFTLRAAADLRGIADYLSAENPEAAGRVRAAILDSLKLLRTFPRAGRRQSAPGVRKLVVRKFGYIIYYSIRSESDEVAILTIRHPARRRRISD